MVLCFAGVAMAQTETATISGLITDDTGAVVPSAEVKLQSVDRGSAISTTTNNAGIYVFASVHPGPYQLTVHKPGFKQVDFLGLIVNVQDHIEQNFHLQVGSVAESVTVEASALQVNTTDATVSTVVDRQFAENLPLNGRSFQTLIELTPGVVLTASNASDGGQFSVNGQRSSSNYWTVDGVSANIGVSSGQTPGNGFGGALGSFSAFGGTNSLVSVDAMQEFRIQTSTYAPEFGRTPGGQISIVTRSGTNQFHGTAFDYLRNDVFDANNWFNRYTNNPPLPKAMERQNDFGGTFGGPILKDRTFFFFSYEGLRLRLPQTALTDVPDAAARQNAIPAVQPFLNAFPFDPGQPNLGGGMAQFNASFSDPGTLDAYSLRIDHRISDKLALFGRYNYSPSQIISRGAGGTDPLSNPMSNRTTTQTGTVGATWVISPTTTNDLRFNYSRTNASSSYYMDNFGGAVPLTAAPFPSPYTNRNAFFQFGFFFQGGFLTLGKNADQLQQQINVVDNLSVQRGSHSLKFGVDFRRLTPSFDPALYEQAVYFSDVPSAEIGSPEIAIVASSSSGRLLLRDLGVYAQDTWRLTPRLTLTYGVRWDVEAAPTSISGPSLAAATGFNLNNLSNLALAPSGTPPYRTTYGNFAPRVGGAYQLRQSQDWQTVLRGGFGVFYDLASSEIGNNIAAPAYPFGGSTTLFGPILGGTTMFPLSSADAAPPAIAPPDANNGQGLDVFDPHLRLPYTLEWNVALEQALGKEQTISASYIGALGKRLLQTASINAPNPNLAFANLITNAGTSDYDALQVQFQRRLSHGLQVLASYTWAHSIDTASAGSTFVASNTLVPSAIGGSNRGPSDFDIRNAFSVGLTYDVPMPKINAFANAILSGWSTQNFILARSAPPVDISDFNFSDFIGGVRADVRPDLVPGQPLYLYGSQCADVLVAPLVPSGQPVPSCPGGKGFNPNAFQDPPSSGGIPLRQGDVPRNFLRGFGASQWDFAIHRDFRIREWLNLQFRAEMFNVLNHPNFGQPGNQFGRPAAFGGFFGLSSKMLAQYLDGGGFGSNVGGGSFSSLYQIGGPRSMQFALKLSF
jgi:hypothetical protein